MGTMLVKTWTRYFNADRRQLPLFPDWERMRWLSPLPSLGAAFALGVLVAVGTPWSASDVIERTTLLMEPAAKVEESGAPQYDLAAIPEHIKAAAQRHRLSEELITAVISVESNFDHAAVSQKGARGLMQLMPATASIMGVRDPHDPDENIDAGASHLRAMLDTFKGDLPLALAAYNAGEQNVIRHRGIPPFQETRQFVARVLRRMGDKKGAEAVMAKPIPSPQWVARSPRAEPKVRMASPPPAYPSVTRPSLIQVSAPRAGERPAAQLVLHELEQRPSSRTWSPTPSVISTMEGTADTPPSMPAPTVLIGQSP
jgi:transglycosylase-like protein with SLT domain